MSDQGVKCELCPGQVVYSAAGRDRLRPFAVVGKEEGRILIADGKLHRQSSPKKKNPSHLRPTEFKVEVGVCDKQLYKSLKESENLNRDR